MFLYVYIDLPSPSTGEKWENKIFFSFFFWKIDFDEHNNEKLWQHCNTGKSVAPSYIALHISGV